MAGRAQQRISQQALRAGAALGRAYKIANMKFAGLSPDQQRIAVAAGGAVVLGTVSSVGRVIRYKNPNVRAARAYRRQRTAVKKIERHNATRGINGKPGVKVRFSAARAGSLRSRSDRLYNRAGAAENKLGKMVGQRKGRGKARLRIQSVKFPDQSIKSRGKFYAKTSIPASTLRGVGYGLHNARRVPKKGTFKQSVRAGVYRGRSDRYRYRANMATNRAQRRVQARQAQLQQRALNPGKRRHIRVRRDSRGRYAGSY